VRNRHHASHSRASNVVVTGDDQEAQVSKQMQPQAQLQSYSEEGQQ